MFSHLNTALNHLFTHFDISTISPYMSAIKAFVIIYLGLLITIKGYLILAGRYPQPFKKFVYEMIVWSLITTIAFNTSGYWAMISEAIDGVHIWAGGGVDLYVAMDNLAEKTTQLSGIFQDIGGSINGTIASFILWAGFLIASVGVTFILIGTTFTLKLLILVAPFAIVSLLFGWIKQTFKNWLVLLLSNTLTVLLIGIILKAITLEFDTFISVAITGASKGGFGPLLASYTIFVFCIFIAFLSKTVLNLASGIAGGGIDSMATRATEGLAKTGFSQAKSASRNSVAMTNYVANKFKKDK